MKKHSLVGIAALAVVLVAAVFIGGSGPAGAQADTQQQQTDLVQKTHDLMPVAEQLRGLKFTAELPVELVDQEQMKKIISGELDQQMTAEMDHNFSELYAFLGLMPAGSSMKAAYQKMAEEQAAGLYDPTAKKFYVVNIDMGAMIGSMLGDMGNLGGLAQGLMEGLGYDLSGTMSDAIIVHELTHALDDQHFDLGGVMDRLEKGDSDDAALAYQSLGEGDATRVMNDYAYQELGIDSSTMNEYSGLSHSVAEAAMNYPPFLERLMVTPYVKGEALVRYLLDQGGEDAVNAAFQRPPESMEQIMHPDRFYPNRDNPSSVAAPDLSAALPGWHKEAQDTLGELITGFMFEVGLNDADKGARIADGWDGDRLSTWRASNNDLAMGWVTAWDSNAEADEFYTSYQELIEARYHNEGTWQDRGPKYSEYVGMGRAAAIEISDNTVVILEGVPEGDVDKCLDAIWNTPVTYR